MFEGLLKDLWSYVWELQIQQTPSWISLLHCSHVHQTHEPSKNGSPHLTQIGCIRIKHKRVWEKESNFRG